MRVLQQVFDGFKFIQQFCGGLLPHSGTSGNIIGRIAHQSQQINHLKRIGQRIFFHHFLVVQYIKIVAAVLGFVNENMRLNELSVILIGSHHIDIERVFVGLFGNGSDNVVGFKSHRFQHRNVISFQNFFDDGNRCLYVFGSGFALRFVGFELRVSERWPGRIESHGNVARIFLSQHIFQRIHESEDRRCILSFRIYAGIFNKCVVRSVNQCISIEHKQLVSGHIKLNISFKNVKLQIFDCFEMNYF